MQVQYSSSIIFSVLRHLRDISKICLLPSSQPGDIKQNQHSSDDRASPLTQHPLALPKTPVPDKFSSVLCSIPLLKTVVDSA